MKMKITVLILLNLIKLISSANILILHPMYAASHILTLRSLAKELANQGHQVDIYRWRDGHKYPEITTFGITETVLAVNNSGGTVPLFSHEERAQFVLPMKLMWENGLSITAFSTDFFGAVNGFCKTLMKNSALHAKLAEKKYDVAIVDLLFNFCSLGLAHHLNIPTIGYWAFSFTSLDPMYSTVDMFPSIHPQFLSHYTEDMNFFQRVVNHMYSFIYHAIMQAAYYETDQILNYYLDDVPHIPDILSNLSGVLINTNAAVDQPMSLPPSFIEIGGLQLRTNKSPLPMEIAKILDESEEGVILFTMGSIFDFNFVPAKVANNFMNAFRQLKQQIIVKSTGTPPVDIPKNVHIFSWVPQQDILAHKNVKLFVTHCGMHGVLESLHHGVPMVGIPVFFDQMDVLVRLVKREVATYIDKNDNSQTILNNINEVLNNPKYKKNTEKLSKIIHDSPVPPMDKAKWLVNHVINTKGAEHLKLYSRHMNMFQLYGLDVYIFLVLSLIVLNYLRKIFFKRIFDLCVYQKFKVE